MIPENYLLSTAYFPPVQYLALCLRADEILIEREENYSKQTYRNRCNIYSANGPKALTVPVLEGSFHKTRIRDIRIDNSKRWKQVHLRSLIASYRSAPYFEYYFDLLEGVISPDREFLLDLNMHSLEVTMKITGIDTRVRFTDSFATPGEYANDFRFTFDPKKPVDGSIVRFDGYYQVFADRSGFIPGLSIIDLIMNKGPDSREYLKSILTW